jgi:hypothetical protein
MVQFRYSIIVGTVYRGKLNDGTIVAVKRAKKV